jgi:uncharacterized protein
MGKELERRYTSIAVAGITLRGLDGDMYDEDEDPDDFGTVAGYAARYYRGDKMHQSQNLGGFVERLAPGCFDRCLKSGKDIRILYNHNADYLLGRTTNGTAKVISDLHGLHFSCKLPDTTYAKDARAVIARGDVRGCSFGFITDEDLWDNDGVDENGEQCAVRTVVHATVFECSPCGDPAYLATSVAARNLTQLWPEGVPASIRALQEDPEGMLAFQRSQRRNLMHRLGL